VTESKVVLRSTAERDIAEVVEHYLGEGAPAAARAFVDELEGALDHLARHPELGSPRYGQELNLPGLRHVVLPKQPYVLFYALVEDRLEVWRVLHQRRDIPDWLGLD
jgi:toxin ParE1/3/4